MKVLYINKTTVNLEHNKLYDVISETKNNINGDIYYFIQGESGGVFAIKSDFKEMSEYRNEKLDKLFDK